MMSTPLLTRFAAVAAAALLMTGCESGPEVRADYDKATDFAKYRTFNFLTDSGTAKSIPLQTLQSSAKREMEKRGYTMAQNPDLLIHFQGKVEEKTDIESTPAPMYGPGYGYRGWYGAPYGGWGGSEVTTRRYNVGTLVMDIVDPAKQQVVYQGGISDVITKEMRENRNAMLDGAVIQLFARYPFVAGSGTPAVLPDQK